MLGTHCHSPLVNASKTSCSWDPMAKGSSFFTHREGYSLGPDEPQKIAVLCILSSMHNLVLSDSATGKTITYKEERAGKSLGFREEPSCTLPFPSSFHTVLTVHQPHRHRCSIDDGAVAKWFEEIQANKYHS